jgi:hypothetical protein
MKVVDLPFGQEESYFKCLEEWSPEMQDSGMLKEQWFTKMRGKGLRVKVAVDDQGAVGGMIHYCRSKTCRFTARVRTARTASGCTGIARAGGTG